MLESRDAIDGAAVLDLYAGSGAFGLEALSRGAASAVLVERAPRAARVIRENVAKLRKAAPAPLEVQVAQQSVASWLASAPSGVGLALLDPPYDLPDADVAADLVALAPLLTEDAVVLVERSVRSPVPPLPPALVLERTRTYGDTAVHVLTPAAPAS
jgi:16S rRNA (guanine966-N2)-methyltransferase